MPGPLEGYRIVEATSMVTGPLATMMLGDQGADVIKVEPPGIGDVMRLLGTQRGGVSALWVNCNRSKRSVVLNLREKRGRELLHRLVATADVFVQNFRPGVVERLDIDEPSLRALRPDLVYVSISAWGSDGPYASQPAYDHILQGVVGAAALQARPGSDRPEHVRNIVCDKLTAQAVAQGITAALLARERGAGGQHLRISMLDASIAFLWPDGGANHTSLEEDVVVQPPLSSTYRVSRATDGHYSVAAVTDAQMRGLCRALGRSELMDDPRFADPGDRLRNAAQLFGELAASMRERTRDELLSALRAEGVPCGPVYASMEEVAADPQVVASGTFVESRHPQLGRMRQPRAALRFEGVSDARGRPAPALGEHTDQVLSELGVAASEREQLRTEGAVA
jgi:crotonobetainyl-CoA:carnitine CoA-transferase CaiB-like acyl-CoA transferase